MYKITIKGPAFTEYENIQELDGEDCQDEFSEYFGRAYGTDQNEQALIDKGVHDGYMRFAVEDGKLMTITEYESPVELTPDELKLLGDYTQGQWSDGIGEGFEQNEVKYDEEGEPVYISPWDAGQEITITQEFVK